MKSAVAIAGVWLIVAPGLTGAAFLTSAKENPLPSVITLLTDLETKIKDQVVKEQGEYDAFESWCETTLSDKATAIADAENQTEYLQEEIYKLKGERGSHEADIAHLEKDLAKAAGSMKEAQAMRAKQAESFREEKMESEQCINALDAAITTLGAGSGVAQLISVAADVRSVLKRPTAERAVSEQDLDIVRQFVSKPDALVGGHGGNFLSAAQTNADAKQRRNKNNPFGDYAPQSTQIQGILKSMHDSFTAELAAAITAEDEAITSHTALMDAKKLEMDTLDSTLLSMKTSDAEKSQSEKENRADLDNTKAQLRADKKFFTMTNASCMDKAYIWAQRSNLTAQELDGIAKAMEILQDPETTKIFSNVSESASFMQLAATPGRKVVAAGAGAKAPALLSEIAKKYQSVEIAHLAIRAQAQVVLGTGGAFDGILQSIDTMISNLRNEEKQDIHLRDLCENKLNKNKNTIADLEHHITKAGQQETALQDEINALVVDHLWTEMNDTSTEIDDLKTMRATERADFIQKSKDLNAAVDVLGQAIAAMSPYLAKSSAGSLAQVHEVRQRGDPPETSFQSGDETGNEQASKGIIGILEMLQEDLRNELKVSHQDDGISLKQTEETLRGLNNVLLATSKKISGVQKIKAQKQDQLTDLQELKARTQTDLDGENDVKTALETDCQWVDDHFDTRREKRKAEIDGLNQAKNILSEK